jgi:hypothetical protein
MSKHTTSVIDTVVVMCAAAQRFGSPAADLSKARLRKITFSTQWPPHTRAEGGQVEPVLGAS